MKTGQTFSKSNPLAVFLTKNSPFEGLSDKIVKSTNEIKKGMGERLSKSPENLTTKESAFQSLLDFKPIKGKTSKPIVEIIREIRDTE
jgi:hypothetical protein